MFQTKIFQISTITILLLVVIGIVLWAWLGGSKAAQSKTILENAKTTTQGIEYFYEDQNRFPSAVEFADKNIMGDYLSNFPAQEFSSDVCPESFRYRNPNPQQYELEVCLPKGVEGFVVGWNTFFKTP